MGHKISTYNDVKMKGVEFLRRLYAQSGLCIYPKTKMSKIKQLMMIVESFDIIPMKFFPKML